MARTRLMRSVRIGVLACAWALAGGVVPGFVEVAQASAVHAPGTLEFALKLGTQTRDLLSVGDIRPTPRGEVFGDASVTIALPGNWDAGAGARVGGAWLEFRQPLGASGNIKDQMFTAYVSCDRWIVQAPGIGVALGATGEYGEARSWTDARTYSQEGPRTFVGGGSVRMSVLKELGSRLSLQGELGQAVFHAHAHDPFTRSDFDWLGRTLTLEVGVRLKVRRK